MRRFPVSVLCRRRRGARTVPGPTARWAYPTGQDEVVRRKSGLSEPRRGPKRGGNVSRVRPIEFPTGPSRGSTGGPTSVRRSLESCPFVPEWARSAVEAMVALGVIESEPGPAFTSARRWSRLERRARSERRPWRLGLGRCQSGFAQGRSAGPRPDLRPAPRVDPAGKRRPAAL